jgi:hypothetical protein
VPVSGPSTDPNWSSVTLLLPGDGTNGAQNNTFLDSSANNFTITRNGNTTQGTFSPFTATAPYSAATRGGSGYFDGTGDYLNAGASTNLAFGTGDFTVEYWAYSLDVSTPAERGVLQTSDTVGGLKTTYTTGVVVAQGVTGSGKIYVNVADTAIISATAPLTTSTWQHIAIVRNSGTVTVYVNGTSVASGSATGNCSGEYIAVGGYFSTAYLFNGYISNLRALKGTALYTSNFTPPTSPLTAITNTQLLLNFTNAGIIDNAMMNDLETVGNAQISTAQSKFGGSSMYFDGTGDRLVGANNPNVNIDAGDFTIEGWIYCATPTTTNSIVAKGFGAAGGYMLWVQSTLRMRVYNAAGTQFNAASTGTISANTWTHVAAVRNGGTITLYINGVADGSVAYTGTSTNSAVIEVGSYGAGSADFSGYIDDLRITKGVARYTANFTPPTAAFPLS